MKGPRRIPRELWAYAYRIVPPPAEHELGALQSLLNHEHAAALGRARTWTGKLVREQRVTHILVVSDSLDQHREINRLLEERLKRGHGAFSLTAPMSITEVVAPQGS